MTVSIPDQISRLERSLARFVACVDALREELFLGPLNGWTARDIVAHLIGWNRHVIEGSRQIARGELPFYDIDPGDDYSKVNAALVRRYSSTDRQELLAELGTSAEELKRFLAALDPAEWSFDHGVRHGDETVTIQGTVDELIADYAHHERQIADWAARRAASR